MSESGHRNGKHDSQRTSGVYPKMTSPDTQCLLGDSSEFERLCDRSKRTNSPLHVSRFQRCNTSLEAGNDPLRWNQTDRQPCIGAAYKHLPSVAQYLTSHGARPDVWNRKDKDDWTLLRIAGVHRTGNLRRSEPTAAAIWKIMTDAGVSTALDEETVAAR